MTELVEDVILLIMDFLGEKSTLVTKKIRHNHFTKYGIWIDTTDLFQEYLDCFPEAFYRYDINLKNVNYDKNYIVGKIKYLGDRFINHLFSRTTFIYKGKFKNTFDFPNLKSVKKINFIGSDLSLVQKLYPGKIQTTGYNYLYTNCETVDDLGFALGKKYNIIMPSRGIRIITDRDTANRISECDIWNTSDILFPNLRVLYLNSNIDPLILNAANFPNLDKLRGYCGDFGELKEKLPQVKKLGRVDVKKIGNKKYREIMTYNYYVTIRIFTNEDAKKLLKLYHKWGITDRIKIFYEYSSTTECKYLIKIASIFPTKLCLGYAGYYEEVDAVKQILLNMKNFSLKIVGISSICVGRFAENDLKSFNEILGKKTRLFRW